MSLCFKLVYIFAKKWWVSEPMMMLGVVFAKGLMGLSETFSTKRFEQAFCMHKPYPERNYYPSK